MRAGGADFLEVGHELRVVKFLELLLEQFTIANDRVERRAQLVTHVGQKGALGLAGRFRRFLGFPVAHIAGVEHQASDRGIVKEVAANGFDLQPGAITPAHAPFSQRSAALAVGDPLKKGVCQRFILRVDDGDQLGADQFTGVVP